MTYKFSPKFAIITAYPMMFSSADLKYVELDMIHAIISDEIPHFKESSESSSTDYFDTLEITIEFHNLLRNRESEWLHVSRQQLEYIWEMELGDSSREDLKKN